MVALCACDGSPATGDDPVDPGEPPSNSESDAGPLNGSNGGAVTVAVAVDGPGRVTSIPAGIDCGGGATDCSAAFDGTSIVLRTDDATTVRWSGDCAGNGDCTVALGADRAVTAATFAPLRRTFDGADHGQDACFAIAAGAGDSIVVTGEVQRFAQGHNAWARTYTAAGDVAWSYELSTPSEGHDRGAGIVALADGSALIAGTWYSGSNTRWNSFVLGFTAAGAVASSQVNEIVADDMYTAIARGSSGQLFVAGARADASGSLQSWIRGLAPNGAEQWAVSRDGSAPGSDSASGIAVDAAGDVVAAGAETNTGTGNDGWIAKYSPAGALRWSVALATAGADWINDVAVGPDSIAVVGIVDGAGTIRVLDPSGAARWDVTAADGITWGGVAIDAAGNVAVTGTAGSDLVVRKYGPAGALIWQRKVAGARGTAIATDSHGSVLVCGAVVADALILRFDQ